MVIICFSLRTMFWWKALLDNGLSFSNHVHASYPLNLYVLCMNWGHFLLHLTQRFVCFEGLTRPHHYPVMFHCIFISKQSAKFKSPRKLVCFLICCTHHALSFFCMSVSPSPHHHPHTTYPSPPLDLHLGREWTYFRNIDIDSFSTQWLVCIDPVLPR